MAVIIQPRTEGGAPHVSRNAQNGGDENLDMEVPTYLHSIAPGKTDIGIQMRICPFLRRCHPYTG